MLTETLRDAVGDIGNFAPTIFQPKICHAWIYLSALRDMLDSQQAEQAAFNIAALIDGIWMRATLQAVPMSSTEALSHMEFALAALFCETDVDMAELRAARKKITTVSEILFKV